MGDAEALRDRLGELVRVRRSAQGSPTAAPDLLPNSPGATSAASNSIADLPPAAGRAPDSSSTGPPMPAAAPVGVESFLPGGVWRGQHGAVFVHERLRSDIERRRPHWGRTAAGVPDLPELEPLDQLGLEHAVFLDLETGGLSSSPVFLAGTMHWNGEDFVLRQYFARHYGEEAALIEALGEFLRGFDALITFNGKSYDAPFLQNRALLHGVPLRWPALHLDLLHLARRRWKAELMDCRLQTLERHVCRRRRSGDVPGEEVPGLYHDYVKRGDPYRLIPVFHHNLLDVITMAEILRALSTSTRPRVPLLHR